MTFGMGHEDLRDLIAASELHDGFGDIATAKNSRFDLQAPREAKVLFHCLSFLGWQLRQFGSGVHEERSAIGVEIVGYAASSTDEHGGRRIRRDMDEDALLWLIIDCSAGTRFAANGW